MTETKIPDKKYDFKQIEQNVTSHWKKNPEIIEKSITDHKDRPTFSFLEGPPTANAPPALHHVECRVFKDLFNRYKFMQGFSVARKGGWDCHGLPVEVQVEKKLGLETKKDVIKYGINKFINECKTDVFTFIKDWNILTERLAFWVDLENPYRTLDTPYMESVWWSLSELFKKDLLYKGYKVVPYCPRCETPLSSHEVSQGYKEVEEDTVAVKLELKDEKDTYLLAWTTTPWTLLSNLCAAVNNNLDYSYVEQDGSTYILASDLADRFFERPKVKKQVKGKDLIGKEYVPIFKHFVGKIETDKKPWVVVAEDYVTTEEGSGIVHQAPAFGEIDYDSCKRNNVGFVNPVAKDGTFTDEITEFKGRFVKDCDEDIIKWLKENDILFETKKYVHTYPFCWRCKSPLLYYAMDSWFIAASKFQNKMLEHNQKINWYPNHIKEGRFGNWLEGAKDWALSRNKFWGTPLPIWVCEKCEHMTPIGSIEELEKRSTEKVKIDDLHLPTVNKIMIKCEKCGEEMQRTPEVIDCWYDSGSAPFAQFHYPFENKDKFKNSHPYGFIAEAIDQTRGWFYVMHVISTILFDKPAYLNCAVAGHLCDDNGEKMSKSKGNIIKPLEIFDEVGVDAVRLLMCSYALGDSVRFGRGPLNENVLPFFNTLWNSYYFAREFMERQSLDGLSFDKKKLALEDRWILSRVNSLIEDATNRLERHEYNHAISAIQDFVINDLSRTYIKLIRDRTVEEDAELAYVFRTVFDTVTRLLAPFTPYLSEEIYLGFTKKKDGAISIHLESWPKSDPQHIDKDLEKSMQDAKDLIQSILQARDKGQIGTRWPLGEVLIVSDDDSVKESVKTYGELIKQQTNIKGIAFIEEFDKVSYTMKPNYKNIGAEYGLATGDVLTKLKTIDEQDMIKGVLTGGYEFNVSAMIEGKKENVQVKLTHDLIALDKTIEKPFTGADFGKGSLYIDTTLTEQLENEGYAREVVRRVQQLRKEASLEKGQKIDLFIWCDMDLHPALKELIEASVDKVGAKKVTISTKMPEDADFEFKKDDKIKSKQFCVLFNVA